VISKPILLVQWLKPIEYRETRAALAEFAKSVNIDHADVQTKVAAKEALDNWLTENAGNTQYPFIGGHGVADASGKAIGIGASAAPAESARWTELWEWMARGTVLGGLWLGGCKTGDAAAALTPLMAKTHRMVIPYIVGFAGSIYPKEIEQVLRQLLKNTDTHKIVPLDEELQLIRTAVKGTKVVMYYPANTKERSREYVNVDDFEQRVGITFRKHLENGG
jgi:hypothetical protein